MVEPDGAERAGDQVEEKSEFKLRVGPAWQLGTVPRMRGFRGKKQGRTVQKGYNSLIYNVNPTILILLRNKYPFKFKNCWLETLFRIAKRLTLVIVYIHQDMQKYRF